MSHWLENLLLILPSQPSLQPLHLNQPHYLTPSGNNVGTTIFVLGLLAAAIVVTIALSLYARKLYRER
jgi:hypothetical protein